MYIYIYTHTYNLNITVVYIYVRVYIYTDKYNCLRKCIIRLNLQNKLWKTYHKNIPSYAILNHFYLYACEYLQNYFVRYFP